MENSNSKTKLTNFINLIIIPIYIGFFLWIITLIKEFEHRLTELETSFKNCVDCSKKEREIGGIKIETFTGSTMNELTGEIDLEVDIDILSEQCRWACGSAREILQGGVPINFNIIMKEYVKNGQLENIKGLICVGAASSEGSLDNEENRAQDRMEYLINLVKNNSGKLTIPIYGLNIGKFMDKDYGKCTDKTIDQRRIIIFKILKKDVSMKNYTFENKIKNILLSKVANTDLRFPIDIKKYSKFQTNQTMLTVGRDIK